MYHSKKILGMAEKFENRKLCIGVIIFFNCLVNIFCFTYNCLQDGDEFSSIAFPVYLAGGDWSEVVANTASWHGYGHVLIYAPFFKFCKSGTEMYNICRIGSLLSWILLSVFIFYIASKIFELENLNSLLIALVCTLGNLKPDYGIGLSTMTELPMGIIATVCMFFLIKINSVTGIKKNIYSFLLFFLLFYSFSIHSRGIVLILTALVIILLSIILWKDMLVSPVFGIMGGGIGFLVYKLLNGVYINRVLTSSTGIRGSLGNDISRVKSSGVAGYLEMFASTEHMKVVFHIFFSLLSGFIILSFGVISLFIVADIQYVIQHVRHHKKTPDNLLLGILTGLISLFMMNGFVAIKQYKTVLAGDLRWYIYLRYAMPFAIIIVLTGLVVILKKKCNIKEVLKISTLINIFMLLFFLKYPFQELRDTSIMDRLANIFRQYFYNGENAGEYFYKMIMLALSMWFLMAYFLRKNKQVAVWGGYILISMIFTASAVNWHYNRAQAVYPATDASEKIIERSERGNSPLDDIKIYCNGKSNRGFSNFLRINCLWSEIYYISKDNFDSVDWESSIVLSNNAKLDKEIDSVYKVVLDENEYLYTRNPDVYNWLNIYLVNE